MATGIDMATDSGRCLDEIAAAGVRWVGRYYRNPGSRFPPLTLSELRLLSSHGLAAVAIWEAASIRVSYFTRLTGLDDATAAYRQAHVIGQSAGTPIYFAVDYDASNHDLAGPILHYFEGVKAGLQAGAAMGQIDYKVGVYGSGRVCRVLLEQQRAEYTWLAASRAWAENREFTQWNIKQSLALVPGVSCDHDSNETQGEFGSFRHL